MHADSFPVHSEQNSIVVDLQRVGENKHYPVGQLSKHLSFKLDKNLVGRQVIHGTPPLSQVAQPTILFQHVLSLAAHRPFK